MRRLVFALSVLSALMMMVGCAPSPIKDAEGKTFYTQINMWSYNGELETTNYAVDTFIPINRRVNILDTSDETIVFKIVESGRSVTLINIEEYTRKDIKGIHSRYFSETPVDLSSYSEREQRAIADGKVVKGISKEAVLLARGYPPAHRTPSLESSSWRFWQSRFDTVEVNFDDGIVAGVKD